MNSHWKLTSPSHFFLSFCMTNNFQMNNQLHLFLLEQKSRFIMETIVKIVLVNHKRGKVWSLLSFIGELLCLGFLQWNSLELTPSLWNYLNFFSCKWRITAETMRKSQGFWFLSTNALTSSLTTTKSDLLHYYRFSDVFVIPAIFSFCFLSFSLLWNWSYT